MVLRDLAGRGPEGLRVLRIDAAFDGVADDGDLFLLRRQVAAGGDADLLQHEVDIGDASR